MADRTHPTTKERSKMIVMMMIVMIIILVLMLLTIELVTKIKILMPCQTPLQTLTPNHNRWDTPGPSPETNYTMGGRSVPRPSRAKPYATPKDDLMHFPIYKPKGAHHCEAG